MGWSSCQIVLAKERMIEKKSYKEFMEGYPYRMAANPQLLNYRYIEKLAPGIQVMLVPNDNPYILPLPELAP